MAVSESIRHALDALNDELLMAKLTADSFGNLHADLPYREEPLVDPHAWVFVFERTVLRVQNAAQLLEVLVRQQAIPLLDQVDVIPKA